MSDLPKTKKTKSLGVKSTLLINGFHTFFPGCQYEWKNSQGVFNSIDRCMVKRSMCYTSSPISCKKMKLPVDFKLNEKEKPTVWGLCGVRSTRANKADDNSLILCNKMDKHFRAYAIVQFVFDETSETGLKIGSVETECKTVDSILEVMKKEKDAFSEDRWERKRARKREEYFEQHKPKPKSTRLDEDDSPLLTSCDEELSVVNDDNLTFNYCVEETPLILDNSTPDSLIDVSNIEISSSPQLFEMKKFD